MSFPQPCSACSRGQHSGHRAGANTRAGLIGGSVCECPGDCAITFQNSVGRTLTLLQLAENEHMTLRQYHELLDRVSVGRSETHGDWASRGPVCAVCGDYIRPCPDPDGGSVPCEPWHHINGGHDHDASLGRHQS